MFHIVTASEYKSQTDAFCMQAQLHAAQIIVMQFSLPNTPRYVYTICLQIPYIQIIHNTFLAANKVRLRLVSFSPMLGVGSGMISHGRNWNAVYLTSCAHCAPIRLGGPAGTPIRDTGLAGTLDCPLPALT